MEWIKGIVGLLGAGALWELFKFIYPDLKKLFGNKSDGKKILYRNINPILKSADELLGKIHSLARSDFKSLRDETEREEHDLIYVMYLFSNFWGRLMILRLESDYTTLSQIEKGRELLKFVTTYEARKNRIIDRSLQRTFGESLIINQGEFHRLKTLYEFTIEYKDENSGIKEIFKPLRELLENTGPLETRQKILQFGIIIHALIDHFDPKHKIIRDRKSYEYKLNTKTRRELQKRVFKHYLPFVLHHNKYYIKKKARQE